MRKLILIAALLLTSAAAAQIINEGASFVTGGGGGAGGPVALIKQTEQREGSTFTVVGKSTLDFSHRLSVQYRYIAGAYALHVGQSNVALTYTDYFADAGTSHNESKLITTPGLYDGDSLYVRVVVAALDSSVVLDTLERGYLIDHDIVTLAMGNPYGGTMFNPTGLVPTQTVTCTAANFRSARLRGGTQADSLSSWTSLPTTMFMRGATTFNPVQDGAAVERIFLWWDLSEIPDDVTITDAYLSLRMNYANNVALAADEGLWAVLDTLSADTQWIAANQRTQAPYINNTSHNEPRRGLETAWSPLLNSRTATWHYGIRSPLARDITGDAGTLATGDTVQIDIKELMQYWVDFNGPRGIRQAGFYVAGYKAAGGSYQIMLGDEGTVENQNPSLVVRYQQKKYSGYDWEDFPFVFVYTTDDAHVDNVDYYKPIFDERGLKYTLFANSHQYDGIRNRMDDEQLQEFYNDGYEIGQHGNWHRSLDTVSNDSLYIFIRRTDLAARLGLVGADTMNIVTFAYANGDTSTAAIDSIAAYGYYMGRMANNYTGPTMPTPLLPDTASEVFKVGCWRWDQIADNDDIGAGAQDSVRVHLRKIYGYSAYHGGVDGGVPIFVLSHGTVDGSSYDDQNPEPLEAMLDVIVGRGDTWVTTAKEAMEVYRQTHEAAGPGGKVWVPK